MNNLLIGQAPALGVKQNKALLMSLAMQQAFHVLQMPLVELEQWLKDEIEQNPALEYQDVSEEEVPDSSSETEPSEIDFETSRFEVLSSLDEGFESALFEEEKHFEEPIHKLSLYEHLMVQAEMALPVEELLFAEVLIGNLDQRGFLAASLSTLFNKEKLSKAEAVLAKIQAFDPPGIAAPNLKMSLLLQLCLKGKEETLAYLLIDRHFDDLVHNRLRVLQKSLGCSDEELHRAVFQEIANLDLHPAARFNFEQLQSIAPDLIILKEEDSWQIEVNEETLPAFRVAPAFIQSATAEASYFRKQVAAAKWLERILERRRKILKEIGSFLIKRQAPFLSGETKAPAPLTMLELAEALEMHHSTIVRAVAHKYVHCAPGLFPLRSFFTHVKVETDAEAISPAQVKELLKELIEKEDKRAPLSDQALAEEIQRQGVSVARRTMAKYRQALKIAPASHRKKYL